MDEKNWIEFAKGVEADEDSARLGYPTIVDEKILFACLQTAWQFMRTDRLRTEEVVERFIRTRKGLISQQKQGEYNKLLQEIQSLKVEIERLQKWKSLFDEAPDGAKDVIVERMQLSEQMEPFIKAWRDENTRLKEENEFKQFQIDRLTQIIEDSKTLTFSTTTGNIEQVFSSKMGEPGEGKNER